MPLDQILLKLPVWSQLILFLISIVITSPLVIAIFSWWTKDKRVLKGQEEQALIDDQREFLNTMIDVAKQAPELMRRNEELLNQNSVYIKTIVRLEETLKQHEGRISDLEKERDELKRQASRVPKLEAQVLAFTRILDSKEKEILQLKEERRNLMDKVGGDMNA